MKLHIIIYLLILLQIEKINILKELKHLDVPAMISGVFRKFSLTVIHYGECGVSNLVLKEMLCGPWVHGTFPVKDSDIGCMPM